MPAVMRFTNIRGALVTMPHKVSHRCAARRRQRHRPGVRACNAVLKRPDGSLYGEMFDGAGFTRGVTLKGVALAGAAALVVGAGGVGLRDRRLARRRRRGAPRRVRHAPRERGGASLAPARALSGARCALRPCDPAGFDVAVNATPLGMNPGDPLPMDVTRLAPSTSWAKWS
jgi:shikimate dehydrogenase